MSEQRKRKPRLERPQPPPLDPEDFREFMEGRHRATAQRQNANDSVVRATRWYRRANPEKTPREVYRALSHVIASGLGLPPPRSGRG